MFSVLTGTGTVLRQADGIAGLRGPRLVVRVSFAAVAVGDGVVISGNVEVVVVGVVGVLGVVFVGAMCRHQCAGPGLD